MLKNKIIAVVVPAYNEENQIGFVIETMPDFVDRVIVINDCSTDRTEKIVQNLIKKNGQATSELKKQSRKIVQTPYNRAEIFSQQLRQRENQNFTTSRIINTEPEKDRIILINHLENAGVGGAIATGYKWCRQHNIDCTAVMAGDGQMDPSELESICNPVIEEDIDYVKGNRLIHHSAWLIVPKVRFLGNSILSILTKIASGYWHVSDTQSGYTAISKKALNAIRIHEIYKSYGMPNDMLVKLNIAYCTLKEVEIKPVYDIGEQSKMKILKVAPRISWLLCKSFFKRLWIKYLFRDFHPLFLLYHFSLMLFVFACPYGIKVLFIELAGERQLKPVTMLAFMFFFISSFQSLLFAMWMDIQDNDRLYK